MNALEAKEQILEDAGYAYSFDREIYIDRKARKAFSVDLVEDHPEFELRVGRDPLK